MPSLGHYDMNSICLLNFTNCTHHSSNILHSFMISSYHFISLFAHLFNVILIIVLVGLYEEPERPPNAVDYIKRYMGAPTGVDVDAMRSELEQLKQENSQLKQTVADLKEKQEA